MTLLKPTQANALAENVRPTGPAASAGETPVIIDLATAGVGAARAAQGIVAGLMDVQAWVSPKYFYDALGSQLFETITELAEYYPTRAECALLEQNGESISLVTGKGAVLIDLGAGNCAKARGLFGRLQPSQYVAVDVAVDTMRPALHALQTEFPYIEMLGIGADIGEGINLPKPVRRNRRLFFYPGSSIGNFSPDEALRLLTQIRELSLSDGGLLIGIDLIKDEAVLHAAYNDALGVTAAFNLNLLNNLNKIIGSDFVVAEWQHRAAFNARQSRIEMYLQARNDVHVSWPGGSRDFSKGESIHTENSYKYSLPQFEALLRRAEFSRINYWTDADKTFAVFYAAGDPLPFVSREDAQVARPLKLLAHQTTLALDRYYARVRGRSEALSATLSDEDCCVQSMPDASPVKWHLAHTTWFFETFVLEPFEQSFRPFHEAFRVMFNSYYHAVGERHPRLQRGMLTRPSLATVLEYRRNVDERMRRLFRNTWRQSGSARTDNAGS
jgi:dimethylhistidine N-methyltransferase